MAVLRRPPRSGQRAIRSEVERLRQLGDDLAVVFHDLAGTETRLQRQPLLRARIDCDVESVPVLELRAVLVRERVYVRLLRELRGNDVVESGQRISAAIRQARIQWRDDVELREVFG